MTALEMDPQIRARWVAALRSGEYEQGREVLRSGDTFCCLGVLCELAIQDGALAPPSRGENGNWLYGGTDDYLPDAVQNWAGLTARNPYVTVKGAREPLAILNDQGGLDDDGPWTFAQIADLIEGGAS